MLEIENEKFETETRVKDEKITDLEHKATILTEKLLMLKFKIQDQEDKGQKMEVRFKDELKELIDELEVLKKKGNDILSASAIGTRVEESKDKIFSSKNIISEDDIDHPKNRVSIMVMGVELEKFKALQKPSLLVHQTSNIKSDHRSYEDLNLKCSNFGSNYNIFNNVNSNSKKYVRKIN